MKRRSRMSDAQPDRPLQRSGPILLWIGAAVFGVSIFAGVARSFMVRRALPSVGVEYTTELNRIIKQKGSVGALPEIRAAARIDFENVQAVTRLLETAREAGDTENALWALITLVRLKPEDADVRNQLVSALLDQGRVVEAYAQGEFAMRLSPNSSETFCNLGAALLGMNRKPEAAAAYRRALELNPNSETARLALEYPLQGF